MTEVGQDHIYTVYVRYSWQGFHKLYGHIRYTVYARLLCINSKHMRYAIQLLAPCAVLQVESFIFRST